MRGSSKTSFVADAAASGSSWNCRVCAEKVFIGYQLVGLKGH